MRWDNRMWRRRRRRRRLVREWEFLFFHATQLKSDSRFYRRFGAPFLSAFASLSRTDFPRRFFIKNRYAFRAKSIAEKQFADTNEISIYFGIERIDILIIIRTSLPLNAGSADQEVASEKVSFRISSGCEWVQRHNWIPISLFADLLLFWFLEMFERNFSHVDAKSRSLEWTSECVCDNVTAPGNVSHYICLIHVGGWGAGRVSLCSKPSSVNSPLNNRCQQEKREI